jgi:hypothetical protein
MRAMLSIGLLVALSVPALAAERAPDRKVQVERRDGKVVYKVPALVIEGQVQRPRAFFVLPRPQVTYQWPDLQRPQPAPALPDSK